MKIKIKRLYEERTSVIGKLELIDDKGKKLFECFTLENKEEGLEANKDLRIPPDTYKLKRHSPSSFENILRELTKRKNEKMICVYNDKVAAKRAILIHWGNTDKHTAGCILLGSGKANNSITNSRKACKDFYDLLKDEDLSKIELVIKNEF